MPRRLPPDRITIPVAHVDGLQDRALWPELFAFLKVQASFKRLVTRYVVRKSGGGELRITLPVPNILTFTWRGYKIRATGYDGELYVACKKAAGDSSQSMPRTAASSRQRRW